MIILLSCVGVVNSLRLLQDRWRCWGWFTHRGILTATSDGTDDDGDDGDDDDDGDDGGGDDDDSDDHGEVIQLGASDASVMILMTLMMTFP